MSETREKCLAVFPAWLESLGPDVQTIIEILRSEGLGEGARAMLVGGLNYLFKALDLVPDGVEDIGYLDDAFVLRLAAQAALDGDIGTPSHDLKSKLEDLASGSALIDDYLGDDVTGRLHKYVAKLAGGAARGRTVDEIIGQPDVFEAFVEEAERFVRGYSPPSFKKEENSLVKLKSYLDGKLPK